MSGEVLVKVEGVKKKFCRRLRTSLWYGLKDLTAEVFGGSPDHDRLRPEEFWAVNDVSFELRRGECLGLIGRNGAGKTTLLKMLNGLIKPDHGRIEMRGRVGALIALGAGFNPILTGRENIYVNGSVLGLTTREINAKIDEIIDFADLREFIDSPVQSYSSGMQVRLGFAVATALEPDILLLDEVLAVGDAAFRNKCYRRIVSMRKRSAVIFVSHNMEQVSRICDQTLVMSNGRVVYLDPTCEGIGVYNRLNEHNDDPRESFLSFHAPITCFRAEMSHRKIYSGESLGMTIQVTSTALLQDFLIRIYIYNRSDGNTAESCFDSSRSGVVIPAGTSALPLMLGSMPLANGRYRFSICLIDTHGDIIAWSCKQHAVEVMGSFEGALCDCHLKTHQWTESNIPIPASEPLSH